MHHLQDGLSLVKCEIQRSSNHGLDIDKTFSTIFHYQDFKITLNIPFRVISHTRYYYLPVVNFGYEIELSRWNPKELRYEYIREHIENDGLSTKKYISSKNIRECIKKFIFHYVKKYLKQHNPPIIIRGPLNIYKQSSERYLVIDSILQNAGYHKLTSSSVNIPDIGTQSKKESVNDVFWMYTRDDISLQEIMLNFIVDENALTIMESQAMQLLEDHQALFVSFLQRNLGIGYNRTVELYNHLIQQEKISKEIILRDHIQ